jgi:phytoene dehydrogenase-like protein
VTHVVVVGGGHNGLVAAAYLARAGVPVTVLEARDGVGGCASTVDALGARVNICNCDHIAVRSTPIAEELDLAAHGLRYLDLDPAYVGHPWDGGTPFVQFHDVARTVDALAATHPADVDGYRRFVRDALPVARLVLAAALDEPRRRHLVATAARRRFTGARRLLEWARRPVADVLHGYFGSPTVKAAAVATGPAVWGASPYWPGTGLGALSLVMKHAVAPGRPVGGSGALTDAIAAAATAAGATIRTGAQVERIAVADRGVTSVSFRPTGSGDGPGGAVERLDATHVLVACDPRVAAVEWVQGAPPEWVAAWRERPVRDGYESKLDAVCSAPPRFTAWPDGLAERLGIDPLVPTNTLLPSVDGIAAAHDDAARGAVADRPIMLVNVPSVLDASMRTPDGGHVLSLEVLFTPYELRGGWDGSDEPRRWLERFATQVEPGFLDTVRDWRLMGPREYERQFGLHRGHAPSFAGGPVRALLGRDPELSRYETPVRGLFLTGAATFPGAGIWGASGRNAARCVLRSLGA